MFMNNSSSEHVFGYLEIHFKHEMATLFKYMHIYGEVHAHF